MYLIIHTVLHNHHGTHAGTRHFFINLQHVLVMPSGRVLKYNDNIKHKKYPLLPYILKSNLHPFYSFRGLKNQMQIRITCGLDSRSRAGFWKNDRAVVRAIRTIQ